MSVIVREARPDEYAAVGALTVAAYSEYAGDFPPAVWRAYRMELRDVAERAKHAVILVAEVDGELAGSVTYYPHGGRDDWETWLPGFASVRMVAVAPGFRGRGLARAMMEAVIARARSDGATGLGLHTVWMMQRAKQLYERMGFQQVEEAMWEEAGGKYWRYELPFSSVLPPPAGGG